MPITSFRRRRGGKGDKRGRHRRPNKYARKAKSFGRRARRRRSSYAQSKQISRLASQIGASFSALGQTSAGRRKRKRPPEEPLSQESRATRYMRNAAGAALAAPAIQMGAEVLSNQGPSAVFDMVRDLVTTGEHGPFSAGQYAGFAALGYANRAYGFLRRARRAVRAVRGAGHGGPVLPL